MRILPEILPCIGIWRLFMIYSLDIRSFFCFRLLFFGLTVDLEHWKILKILSHYWELITIIHFLKLTNGLTQLEIILCIQIVLLIHSSLPFLSSALFLSILRQQHAIGDEDYGLPFLGSKNLLFSGKPGAIILWKYTVLLFLFVAHLLPNLGYYFRDLLCRFSWSLLFNSFAFL